MFNQKRVSNDKKGDFVSNDGIKEILYSKKAREEKENKDLRNSLLNELGDSLDTKHILYSSVDELKKMKEEKEKKNFEGISTGYAASGDYAQKKLTSNKEKVKLLPKIPIEKEKEKEKERIQNIKYKNSEITPIKGYLSYDEKNNQNINNNEINVSNSKENIEKSKIQDEQFNKVMKLIYAAEGGFVDNPNDRGGRTNMGVTQRSFDAYNKKHGQPLKDVKDITKQEATEFYKKEYWEASGADKIEDKNLAYMHYDAAINHGPGRAKQFLEQSGGDFDKYYQLRKKLYDNLAKKPRQQKFHKGWINRIDNINKIKKDGIL